MSTRDRSFIALYVTTGLVWTGRSLLEVAARPDYWEPVSAVDWVAVWAYSLALLLLAVALIAVAADSGSGFAVRVVGYVAATFACGTALANAIEDGLGIESASIGYVVGTMGTAAAMVAFAAALGISRRPLWSAAVLLMLAGVVTMSDGFGALVLCAAGVAIWARRPRGAAKTEPTDEATQNHSL